MTNYALIVNAAKLVVEIEEAEGIMESTVTIFDRVRNWYNHTDITSAEMLASAAMLGNYSPSISYDDIIRMNDIYFNAGDFEIDHGCFSIGEIEESYRDEFWR